MRPSVHLRNHSLTQSRWLLGAGILACGLAACSNAGTSPTTTTAPPDSVPTTAVTATTSPTPGTTGGVATAAPSTFPPTTGSPSTTGVATTETPSTSTGALGCREPVDAPPAGAVTRQVVDVDGDGLPDEAWIVVDDDGTTRFGVVTAAGGGAERVFESASPVKRAVLVADADGRGPVEIFADDGRSVQLWVFHDCAIPDVVDADGDPYVFSHGFSDIGTGVGCVDIDGERQLVGLDVSDDGGNTVEWSRTVVELDGTLARNGAVTTGTFTRPGDDEAIDLLHQTTCGDLTLDDDGLSAPQ